MTFLHLLRIAMFSPPIKKSFSTHPNIQQRVKKRTRKKKPKLFSPFKELRHILLAWHTLSGHKNFDCDWLSFASPAVLWKLARPFRFQKEIFESLPCHILLYCIKFVNLVSFLMNRLTANSYSFMLSAVTWFDYSVQRKIVFLSDKSIHIQWRNGNFCIVEEPRLSRQNSRHWHKKVCKVATWIY